MRSLFSPSSWPLGRCTAVACGLLLTFVLAAPARAQCPAAWVPGIGTPGANGNVNAFAVTAGGDLIVGGSFLNTGGVPSRIARYIPTGNQWSALGSGITGGSVNALAVLPGGDVVVAGQFTAAGGVTASNIARLNPTNNNWSSLGLNVTGGSVNALALLPNGDLLVGGQFSNGTFFSNMVRYSPTSGVWSALGITTDGPIYALAVLPGGEVIVGGSFASAGSVGNFRSNIARYNNGQWNSLGLGMNGAVRCLAVLPGGDVLVGGEFTTAGGLAAGGIARYNPSTITWSAVGLGTNGTVSSLSALPSGEVLVGGAFTAAGGIAASGIVRYNPATGVWTALGAGTDGNVSAIAVVPGGDLILGGNFTSAGGVAATRLARVNSEPNIIGQPRHVVTAPFGTALFAVTIPGASGNGTATYAWRKDGQAINAAANPSAATPALSITNVLAADVGSYDCLVTNSCGGTGTLSSAATLSIVGTPPVSQWASYVIGFSSEYSPTDWAAAQALGAPDTLTYCDCGTAWAPREPNGMQEFITVGFPTPVYATGATIRETFGNGMVYQVDVLDTDDVLHTVWAGTDPSPQGTPVDNLLTWPATPYSVKGIKVYINTNTEPTGGWEEIDAIALHGNPVPCPADFNQDGGIDGTDVQDFFKHWEEGC